MEFYMNKIIKINAVKEQIHLSEASIYRLAKQGDFPKQIKLGVKASGWLQWEIDDWIQERINARDSEVTNV
jgi:prophage regulatory protein